MKSYRKVKGRYLMQQGRQNRKEKEDHKNDDPALSKVIERNIRTIIHLRTKAAHERGLQGRIADAITSFSGRMIFAYVHLVCRLLLEKKQKNKKKQKRNNIKDA